MWNTDHFGWPITARPFAATSTRQFIDVSEVIGQIVQRACDFAPAEVKKPIFTTAASTTTITTTTTTANRSFGKSRLKSAEGEKDDILKEPVQAAASDLVSLISNFFERSYNNTTIAL